MREKILTVTICLIGTLAILYGMMNKNNVIFIIGVLFVVAGYLLIRRKLKETIRGRRG
jgi:LPXTG-motif cell wall-anchored protein